MLRDPGHCLALGFGLGLAPVAPGTFGTLLGVPVYLLIAGLPLWGYCGVVAALFVAGTLVAGRTGRALGVHDHGAIVIDEVVGFLVAMLAAPAGWPWIVAGFLLFRLFDIWKPWPVRLADRHVQGGLGVMLDDLLAGAYALVAIQAIGMLL